MSFATQDSSRAEAEAKHSLAPVLTICVPSYNRGERVRTLVDYLLPTIVAYGGRIELVVSNNASRDRTAELLGEVSSPHFRLHNRTIHLPTAEEHIFAVAALCRGKYIWFLGDDDIPNLETILELLSLLELDRYDFLFFNSIYIDAHGGHLDASMLRMNGGIVEAPFSTIAPALGFISTLAGLSNVVCRRARLDDATWPQIVKISYIYSHVVWWYLSFAGGQAAIVNRPLVAYRQDSSGSVGSDFRITATNFGVGDHHFWTLGLLRLFLFMEERGAITNEQICNIWERRRDGSQFRLLDNMFNLFCAQVVLSVKSTEARNRLMDEEFALCRRWFLRVDPTLFDCMKVIEFIYSSKRVAGEDAVARISWAAADFEALFSHRMEKTARYLNISSFYRCFDIYKHVNGYVGIAQDSAIDRRSVLSWIDPSDDGTEVVTAPDVPSLRNRIDNLLVAKRFADGGTSAT